MELKTLEIHAPMTQDNFVNLVREISACYSPQYARTCYAYDGTHLTMKNREYGFMMPEDEEVDLIAKYATSSTEVAGICKPNGNDKDWYELKFSDGKCTIGNKLDVNLKMYPMAFPVPVSDIVPCNDVLPVNPAYTAIEPLSDKVDEYCNKAFVFCHYKTHTPTIEDCIDMLNKANIIVNAMLSTCLKEQFGSILNQIVTDFNNAIKATDTIECRILTRKFANVFRAIQKYCVAIEGYKS